MESSVYSQDGAVNLFFVRLTTESEDGCSPALLYTFQACEENSLNPEWVSCEECLKMAPTKQDVFVLDPFEGDVFKHLTSGFKSLLVGPRCILSCLQRKEPIPELPSPIHNTAMKGIVLTTTSFEKEERVQVQTLVERMAGIYSNSYHQAVTHMVANSVGSKKYMVAVENNIPILTGEWVRAVWRAASGETAGDQGFGEDVRATDERFHSYVCPVFKGLVICVSQLDRSTKAALKNIIEENGGTYSTTLDMSTTSVLIIPAPEGDKFNHAVNWRIQCLTPDWIHDSVEQGFAMKMDGYNVSKRDTSTPTHDTTSNVPPPDFSMCSTIMNDTGIPKASHIDETLDISVMKKSDAELNEVTRGLESLESLNLQDAMRAGHFLDGCKIFLSGFNPAHLEKLRRVLNTGGATRFNTLSEAVSHVVLGKKVDEHLNTIKSWSSRPHTVYADWITESVKLKRPADEAQFTHHIDSDNFKSPVHLNFKGPRKNSSNSSFACNETHVDEEVLSHYIKRQRPAVAENNTTMNDSINTSSLPNSQAADVPQIFHGKVLLVSGFNEEYLMEVSSEVKERGGKLIMQGGYSGQVDYALTATADRAGLAARELVSPHFISDCIEQDTLLPVQYYHMPLQMPSVTFPLSECVLSTSAYTGKERGFLEILITLLGGKFQEVFAKKSNPQKEVYGSTHLVCPEVSEGGKYRAAIKWGVPVVTGDWLLACAQADQKLPEEQYVVTATNPLTLDKKDILRELFEKTVECNEGGNLTQPFNESDDAEVAPTPMNRKVKALKNQSFCSPSEIKTPDPETFRKLYPTPGTTRKNSEDSLEEMKTPDTPYGSTWYNNPSSRTRKRFKRMLDAIPDPPENSKAKKSTPIQSYYNKFVNDGNEFLKNYKIRNTPVYLRKDKKSGQEEEEVTQEVEETVAADCRGPLTGVVVYTSRKLQEQQRELYKVVTELGGDYRWAYDSSVTHFLFQGRENDLSKEFRQARDDGKLIVAPDWVWMCQDERSRIDEHLFPHTHNPKMTLSLVGGKSSPVKRKPRLAKKNPLEMTQDGDATQLEDLNIESGPEKKGDSDADKNDEEQAKISRQLEEIGALASNSMSTSRKSGGVGRSLTLTDRLRHTPTKPVEVDIQPGVSTEVAESQSTAITWEDPEERQARLRLHHQLTKDTQDIINDNHQLLSKEGECEDKENVSMANQTSLIEDHGGERKTSSSPPVFMIIGMNDDLPHYSQLVDELGGLVIKAEYFDPSTTHVVTPKPSRSERNLGSIASGKWLLHESYLIKSSEHGSFLKEEAFSFGNPEATCIPNFKPGSIEAQLSAAAWRWRQVIHGSSGGEKVSGAFQSMRALIHTSRERVSAFTRLITAGGGTVIKARPPFSDVEDVTHFFFEPNKVTDKVDLASFASRQIPVLSPIYLNNFLIQESPPDEAELYVPEYKEILANMSRSNESMLRRKRKLT